MRAIVLAALLLPLAACHVGADADGPGIAGTGSGNQRSYPVTDFTAIELAGTDNVDVRVGPTYSVRAEGSPAALERLRIDKKGETLEIGRRRDVERGDGNDTARLFVTLPRLGEASVAGSGAMTIDRVEAPRFKAALASSGTLAVGTLAVERVDADLAGSGSFRGAGTAKKLDVNIAGSGSIDAPGLIASAASVSVAGSGNVRATVNGDAKVSIMGSGDIDLGPGARCTTSKMGSGTVRCGG